MALARPPAAPPAAPPRAAPTPPPPTIDPFIVAWVYVALAWVPGLLLWGRVSGWGELARLYRRTGPPPSQRHWFMSGTLGAARFTNTLIIVVRDEGLYLSQLLPFRPGHPPLLIPWTAVQAVHRHADKRDFLVLTISSPHAIGIGLPASLLTAVQPTLPPIQSGTPPVQVGRGILVFYALGVVVVAIWVWFLFFSGWV